MTTDAPAALTIARIDTTEGTYDVPCEPVNEWLAITPALNVDEDGKTRLFGTFTLIHLPTGRAISDETGACINCARAAGAAIAALDLDWASLTVENAREWSAALPPEAAEEFALLWGLSLTCDVELCEVDDAARWVP